MSWRLSLLLILCCSTASANSAKSFLSKLKGSKEVLTADQKSANQIWKNFISCGETKKEADWRKCLDETTHTSLSLLEKQRNFEIITLGFELTELYPCPSLVKAEIKIAHKKDDFLCFQIINNETAIIGYAVFEPDQKKGLKLTRIKY